MKQWEIRGVTGNPPTTPQPAVELVEGRAVRALVDQLPAVFWTTDPALRFTSCLGAGLAQVGLGPNQVVGTLLAELFDGRELRSSAIEAHHEALRGHSVPFDLDLGGHRFRATVGPLTDARGDAIGTIGVALDRDISQAERDWQPAPRNEPIEDPGERRWRARSVRGRAGDVGTKAG